MKYPLTQPTASLFIVNAKKNPHAVALGKRGGSVKSEAKKRAARENAKQPRKRKGNAQI